MARGHGAVPLINHGVLRVRRACTRAASEAAALSNNMLQYNDIDMP